MAKPGKRPKDGRLYLRMHQADIDRWQAMADAAGISLADLVTIALRRVSIVVRQDATP